MQNIKILSNVLSEPKRITRNEPMRITQIKYMATGFTQYNCYTTYSNGATDASQQLFMVVAGGQQPAGDDITIIDRPPFGAAATEAAPS